MKPQQILIKDLAKGDKFYYYDHLIYEVLDLAVIHEDNDRIKLKLKQFKTKKITNISITGHDVINHPVYLYTGRDSSSFHAGFRAAMRVCVPHMQVFDKENAEVENELQQYLRSMEAYNEWCSNNFNEFYCNIR